MTHVDNLQLPKVLDTVQRAVAAGQEVGQVLVEADVLQPGGQRGAAVTTQSLHLDEEEEEQAVNDEEGY